MIDALGTPVTRDRIEEIRRSIAVKSDVVSWEIGLVLDALDLSNFAAQERIAALEAAATTLSKLASHPGNCGAIWGMARECDCGLREARAALAGSQGGGGDEGQDVACTETVHRVQEGADACVCGENRMELLL